MTVTLDDVNSIANKTAELIKLTRFTSQSVGTIRFVTAELINPTVPFLFSRFRNLGAYCQAYGSLLRQRVSRNAELKSSHGSLLNQLVKDVSDLFRALLWVAFLAALVVHEGDTEARLISFSPLEVAAGGR
jgi:hypothetical protein